MKKFLTLVGMLCAASCSQITTNKDELSALEATADQLGDDYVTCVVSQSMDKMSATALDVTTAIKLAGDACKGDLAQFEQTQKEYLSAQYIMTAKPLQASIDALNERATIKVGEAVMSSAAIATVAAPPAGAVGQMSSERQAYLDCMQAQADKYAGLDESAPVIADVAQDRCKSYLAGPEAAALEQEGRAMVMGVVLDAKLAGPDR